MQVSGNPIKTHVKIFLYVGTYIVKISLKIFSPVRVC